MIKESLDGSRKNFNALECCVGVATHTVVAIFLSSDLKLSSKGISKQTFEGSGDGAMAKY